MIITNAVLVTKIIIKHLTSIAKTDNHYLFLTNAIYNTSAVWTGELSLDMSKNF